MRVAPRRPRGLHGTVCGLGVRLALVHRGIMSQQSRPEALRLLSRSTRSSPATPVVDCRADRLFDGHWGPRCLGLLSGNPNPPICAPTPCTCDGFVAPSPSLRRASYLDFRVVVRADVAVPPMTFDRESKRGARTWSRHTFCPVQLERQTWAARSAIMAR
jgi:hypothetical protein